MDKGAKGLKYLNVISGSIQTKTYSFGAFTLVVIIILIAFAIRPTIVKISEINSEIKEKKIVNQKLDDKLKSIASLSAMYAERQEDIKTLPLIFPSQGNFSLLLSNMDEVVKRNGFVLSNISFGLGDETLINFGALKTWSVRITVAGSRANLNKLLADIESMPMYPIIKRLSFSEDSKNKGTMVYTIELMVFKITDTKFYD